MKILFVVFNLTLLLSCSSEKSDLEQIDRLYHEYGKATLAKDIDKMIALSSNETIAYFDKTVEQAKTLDSSAVSGLGPMEKTFVLYLRQTLSLNQLEKYTGKELMQFNLEKSLNTKSDEKIKLTKIVVKSKSAQGIILVNGKSTGDTLEYRKENNQWKYNSMSSFEKTTKAFFYEQLKKTNLTENEFIEIIVSRMSGKEFSNAIWHKKISK